MFEQRMKLAAQINKFSNELIVQASRSNQFILFKSAAVADFDGPNAMAVNNSDRQHPKAWMSNVTLIHFFRRGDFVVFVYYEINNKPTACMTYRILKLEGYFLGFKKCGRDWFGPKVVIDLTSAPSIDTPENILTAKWVANSADPTRAVFTTYFPLVRGLATPGTVDGSVATSANNTPRLFYMTAPRNVIISGQIYSSNKDIATNDWKTYTNSFCFNITPRT